MEKLNMHSPNFVEENIEKIAALFPGCVTEARDAAGTLKKAIDFDLLRQELSTSIVEGPQERYHLDWPGKREALLTANAPISKTLRPCREESVDFDTTENLFIEGDNLDALKLLQETYLGKVKMIYIDPPYNTGKDFIYADNFAQSTEEYRLDSGQKDEEGNRLIANTDSNGRFHSNWLSMMYSRLKLARNLLKDDGVIFISIDDGEHASLKRMCDEIFGEENFISNIIWHKVFASKASAQFFSESHDHIIVYSKVRNCWKRNLVPRTDDQKKDYKNLDNDPRGPWRSVSLSARNAYSSGLWGTTSPAGRVIDGPPTGRYWAISKETFDQLCSENRIWWGKDGMGIPRRKLFLSEAQDGVVPNTIWNFKDVGSTQDSKKELLERVDFKSPKDVFDTPKPVKLIMKMLELSTNKSSTDIILDFFAGAGTTGDAVYQLNGKDGGNRRFILIQIAEKYEGLNFKNIAEISKERIRRAGKKITEEMEPQINTDKHRSGEMDLFNNKKENLCPSVSICGSKKLDIGFRVLKVDSSNMSKVYYTPDAIRQNDLFANIDNIKPDRSSEDLLFQVLLDWGTDLLTKPIQKETVCGNEVFFVERNQLAACFVKNGEITEDFCKELAQRQPLRVVFRDSGFKDDSVKINVEQIFKLMSPQTEVKTI